MNEPLAASLALSEKAPKLISDFSLSVQRQTQDSIYSIWHIFFVSHIQEDILYLPQDRAQHFDFRNKRENSIKVGGFHGCLRLKHVTFSIHFSFFTCFALTPRPRPSLRAPFFQPPFFRSTRTNGTWTVGWASRPPPAARRRPWRPVPWI